MTQLENWDMVLNSWLHLGKSLLVFLPYNFGFLRLFNMHIKDLQLIDKDWFSNICYLILII